MSTPVLTPMGLPYPITVDELMVPIGSYVEKGQRLFAYKFWYMVEIANSPDDNDIDYEGPEIENLKEKSGSQSNSTRHLLKATFYPGTLMRKMKLLAQIWLYVK